MVPGIQFTAGLDSHLLLRLAAFKCARKLILEPSGGRGHL